MALGGNGAFLLGTGGRCPWGPEKMQPELGGGVVFGQEWLDHCSSEEEEGGHHSQIPELLGGHPLPTHRKSKAGAQTQPGHLEMPCRTPPATKSRGLIHHQHICLLEPSSPILFLLPLAALWKLKGYLQ